MGRSRNPSGRRERIRTACQNDQTDEGEESNGIVAGSSAWREGGELGVECLSLEDLIGIMRKGGNGDISDGRYSF